MIGAAEMAKMKPGVVVLSWVGWLMYRTATRSKLD